MAGETVITMVGNLCDAPELRFTPSGAGVAKFTVASTARQMDKATGEWKDMDPTFMACTVWRELAEHVAETLTKGARVIVQGRLKQENWDDKNGGGKRSRLVLEVDEIGPSLKWATATVVKVPSSGGGNRPSGGDQWASQNGPGRGQATGGATTFDEEPPF